MKHKSCLSGGRFELFVIREHNYCFMQCSGCGAYLGGDKTVAEVQRLMQIKVRPTIRRA